MNSYELILGFYGVILLKYGHTCSHTPYSAVCHSAAGLVWLLRGMRWELLTNCHLTLSDDSTSQTVHYIISFLFSQNS